MISTEKFIRDGYVKVESAFPSALAAECRDLLWQQLDESPDDPATWTRPVVRLGYQSGGPFERAVNTAPLREAYDALVGRDRWAPRVDVGTFPVRFPSTESPADDGWHIDSSFPPAAPEDEGDPFAWRVNVASRGRVLLMLFLFSDVDADDAPTRLRVGSHRETARILASYGDEGLTMMEVSQRAAAATADHPVEFATGFAGDVFLCHPFLVHAAQEHHGERPRFLAQPPLHPPGWTEASLDIEAGTAPVEVAIRDALAP